MTKQQSVSEIMLKVTLWLSTYQGEPNSVVPNVIDLHVEHFMPQKLST